MDNNKASIKAYLKNSFMMIITFMAIPVVILSVLLPVMAQRYGTMIGYINEANEVVEIAKRDIEMELWDIVAGNKEFRAGAQYAMVDEIEARLNELLAENDSNESKQYLRGALGMVENLRNYMDDLGLQISHGTKVYQNEGLYREIRRISSSLDDVMGKFINVEMENISQINANIWRGTQTNLLLTVVLMLLIILFAFRSYNAVDNAIKKPIVRLEKLSVKLADGDLSARSPDAELEDLGILTSSLNTMAYKLDELLTSRIEDQKNLRKAEMRTLQEQITPHFIYNTLGAIVYQGRQGNNESVVKITMALTNFLRLSLSKGNDWITVQQEIEHIENYLEIQHFRYGHKLQYRIDIEPQLRQYKILKILLQPLVENALYHGIKEKRGIGRIVVRGTDNADGTMTFCVEDNGIGMSEERLEEVLRSVRKDTGLRDSTYGLYNVNKRISLYYQCDGLSIRSVYGQGTTVCFTIPCLEY